MKRGKYKLPVIYILLGLLWVVSTEVGILSLPDDLKVGTLKYMYIWKGSFFMLFTGGLLYLLIDKEERKNKRSEKQYREIYENNPIPMWFYDPETFMFVSANDSTISSYGYSIKELLAMTVMDIRPAEDIDKFRSFHDQMADNCADAGSWKHLKKDGSIIYSNISCHKMYLDEKAVVMVIAIDSTDKVLFEQQLDRNYTRLENILNSIKESFFTLNKELIVTKANSNFYITTGVTDDVVGRAWADIVPESINSPLYYKIKEAITNREVLEMESYSELLNKWLWFSVYPEEDETTIYFKDITIEKEKDIKLKLALERYNIASMATGEVIYDLDLNTNVLVFSKEISTLVQVSPSEVTETLDWWRSIVHPDDINCLVLQQKLASASIEKYWNAEYRIMTGNGKYKYVYDQCQLIFDDKGQPVRSIGAIRDIDLLKRSADQLRTMGDILNKINSSVIMSDPQGKITWVNPAFCELTGYAIEEAIGQKHTDFLTGAGTDSTRVEQMNLAIDRQKSFSAELQNYTRSAEEYWVTLNLSPIFDVKGDLECYISVETDITARKDKEAELERQNEKLKVVSWLNSHQIRRPVASILGLAQLMKITEDEHEREELLDMLYQCTIELDEIIHQINKETARQSFA